MFVYDVMLGDLNTFVYVIWRVSCDILQLSSLHRGLIHTVQTGRLPVQIIYPAFTRR